MHVSACKTYLAASVRCSGAEIKAVGLIFALRGDPTARPKQISHELEGNRRRGVPGRLAFIGMAFSANTKLLVCHCNHVETGILIYDWSVQQLICTIEVKSMLTHVSFNPKNDTKLCVTGHNGTFQFWHYGPRSAHVAPIEGLPTRNADLEYFNHEWISPDCVVAGCSSGEISLVQGCGERQRVHAFDQPNDHNELVYAKPTYFLIRKEKLFCFSNQNFVSVFDINHQDVTGGRQWSLQLSQRCRLGVIDEIVGLSWTNTNDKDLSVAVFTSSGLYRYELSNLHILTYEEGDEDADDTSVESVERKPGLLLDDDSLGDVTAPSNLVSARSVKKGRGNRAASIMTSSALSKRRDTDRGFRWGYLRPEKVIMRSHQGAVAALSLSRRSSIMATASAVDKTLRTWDFNMTNQSDVMVEDFSDRATDVPNTVDLHPSGTCTL